MLISVPTENEFTGILEYIHQFELDNRDLKREQFLVAKEEEELLGFGRIRRHKGCDEFCSLGVIESKRRIGIATALIQARLNISTQPVFLVCIIPEFFEPMGFKAVDEYPPEMQDKLDYCTSELIVPEDYVVMKYHGNED